MNDLPRQELAGLVAEQGPALLDDPDRCAELLRRRCPGHRKEVNVLLQTLDAGVLADLRPADGPPAEEVLARLAERVHHDTGLPLELTRWGVESWAEALGRLPREAPPEAEAPAQAGGFDIDPPACFYLGREYDLEARAVRPDQYVMVDAREFTTHGVLVGMTGSGKTGLAISLLEEAAIDGYPCVMIDPKGDLTNLLLQFPDLDPKRFAEWVGEAEAREKGMSVPEFAQRLSERWRAGLQESAQSVERIGRLKSSSDWHIYTPGSEAGLPVSILHSFAAPQERLSREDLTQKIDATATALLGLTGTTADPVQSREHVLIAQLLYHAWEKGQDLDLPTLIHQIRTPPMSTVGAYNLETFFPAKERVKFAGTLNNVLAAPGFAVWTAGEPLDLGRMLYKAGKPQQLIFYVAHLDDAQRMFFITLLLEEVLSWTRKQSGTHGLRALVYFDEVFGYIPPHPANPPTKRPLLTLLKQARAFGVGCVLATQNPVDLDYKALSNAGTWFVGKLQTERDKERLLEGLESVAAEHGQHADRARLDRVISSLGNRVFLLHSVYRPAPVVFQSRWALSFLRGPMTREQVAKLMAPAKKPKAAAAPKAIPLCSHCHAELTLDVGEKCPKCFKNPWANAAFRRADHAFREGLARPAGSRLPPVLPADVRQFYLPPAGGAGEVVYEPRVLGFAEVTFVIDRRRGKEHTETVRLLAAPPVAGHPVDWDGATAIGEKLETKYRENASWGEVPDALNTGRKLKALEKGFADHLYSARKLALWENRALELVSEPGEGEERFRERCHQKAAEEARQALDVERAKFTPKFKALGMKLPPDEKEERTKKSFLGWLFTGGSSAEPAAPPASKQEEKERKLEADYQAKRAEIRERWRQAGEEATPIQVKPRRADVRVALFGLGWLPRGR